MKEENQIWSNSILYTTSSYLKENSARILDKVIVTDLNIHLHYQNHYNLKLNILRPNCSVSPDIWLLQYWWLVRVSKGAPLPGNSWDLADKQEPNFCTRRNPHCSNFGLEQSCFPVSHKTGAYWALVFCAAFILHWISVVTKGILQLCLIPLKNPSLDLSLQWTSTEVKKLTSGRQKEIVTSGRPLACCLNSSVLSV